MTITPTEPSSLLLGGLLRVPHWIFCGAVTGHRPSNKPYGIENGDGSKAFIVDDCQLCGARQVLRHEIREPLVQLTT
jgi:hypothetical protein